MALSLGGEIMSSEEQVGEYETTCTYVTSTGARVSVDFFHAFDDGYAAALTEGGGVWTPHAGSGQASGYQVYNSGSGFTYRAVDDDAAIEVSMALGGSSVDDALDTADRVAAEAFVQLAGLR